MDTTSLAETVRTHLEQARTAVHGRSTRMVHGGHDHGFRQTVVAMRTGATLVEHQSSREATLQVLAGRARLTADGQALEAVAGDLVPVPGIAHMLDAVEDSALLHTVAVGEPQTVPSAPGHSSAYSWQEDWE